MYKEFHGKQAVILIVDDQASNIKILREAVRGLGEVYFATSGIEALALAQRCRPDVVLLDIEMQDLDGFQVCAALKADTALKDAAVIFVTSHTEAQFELQALTYGAVDFLQKPLNVPIVRARVRTHVQLHTETRKFAEAQRNLEDLIQHLPAFIAFWSNDLNNLFCNDRTGFWFGIDADDMLGQPLRQVVGEKNFQLIAQHVDSLLEGQPASFEIDLPAPHGGLRFGQVTLIARPSDEADSSFLMLLTDVSERKIDEHARLEFLSRHDTLTHLPNQRYLQEEIRAVIQVQSGQSQVGMLLLDIDHFKTINDTMGHTTGDRLLQLMAARLKNLCQPGDTLSRQGGDEFVILVKDAGSMTELGTYAEHVLQSVSEPFFLDGQRYDLHVSIGISVFPNDSADVQLLFRHAETAMYQAKQEGRHRWRFFSIDTENGLRARHQLERNMRDAVQAQAFEVYYQAKVDLDRAQIIGVEALIRWLDAPGGPLSPADFIPLAEEIGLILPIGQFVLQRACEQGRHWQTQGLNICISVNISFVQFCEAGFLPMVVDVLNATGLRHDLLELEITEGVLVRNVDQTLETLTALRQLGVRIAIDDFGTGYSSLAYLKRFPINVLKIDQSFVRDMLTESTDLAIVDAIINIGLALGLELVAEGVETIEQAQMLQQKGCAVIQGYLYSKPTSFTQMSDLLIRGLP